jgi:Peptidase family M1 domain
MRPFFVAATSLWMSLFGGAALSDKEQVEPGFQTGAPPLIRSPSSPAAWGGPRDDAKGPRSNRVANYALKAVLNPSQHSLEGRATITWKNRASVPISALYAHLYLNAFKSEGSTFFTEMRQLGGFRSGVETNAGEWGYTELKRVTQNEQAVSWAFVHPDSGLQTDETVVRLDLPQAVAPGESTTLHIEFFDQLPRIVARTGWFDSFHLVGQWYPKIGVLELPGERGATEARWNCHEFHLNSEFYADFGSYELEVVVPQDFRVGASGEMTGPATTESDGVHHRFKVDDVHDVVFSAWNGFAEPLSGHTQLSSGAQVNVEVLAPPEYVPGAHIALKTTLDSINWFSEHVGPYPYPHVTVVIPPFNAQEAGGMEYETFFTSLASLSPPLNAESVIRTITIHEFGHGYFSGLIASNEFEEPMLDEGLNEWLDARMLEGEALNVEVPTLLRWLGIRLPAYNYWVEAGLKGGRSRFPSDALAASSWTRWSRGSYGQVYAHTQLVMHDLAVALGPEVTERAIRLYFARWKFRHPSIADLRAAFLDAGGAPTIVENWFEQQVYAANGIDDRIEKLETKEILPSLGISAETKTELTEDARDQQIKTIREEWQKAHPNSDELQPGPLMCRSTVSARRYGSAMPRTLSVTFGDGSRETLDWPVDEPWKKWSLVKPICATEAALSDGPLIDSHLLDNVRTKKSSVKSGVGFAVESLTWLQQLFSVAGAL